MIWYKTNPIEGHLISMPKNINEAENLCKGEKNWFYDPPFIVFAASLKKPLEQYTKQERKKCEHSLRLHYYNLDTDYTSQNI